jgi:hypothetical protein
MRDIDATVLSQYLHSPAIMTLIRSFNAAIDPEAWIAEFVKKVMAVETAESWGLDVWGRIVAIERTIQLQGSVWLPFGFAGQTCGNFGNSNFYSPTASNVYVLQDNAYRLLIMMKAASNITDGSLQDINRIVSTLFADRGAVSVVHVGTMHLRFVVEFVLQPFEKALLLMEDVPPKPAGVGFDVYQILPAMTFGFAGQRCTNFYNGIFSPYEVENGYTTSS